MLSIIIISILSLVSLGLTLYLIIFIKAYKEINKISDCHSNILEKVLERHEILEEIHYRKKVKED